MFYTENDMAKVSTIEKYLSGVIEISDVLNRFKCHERTAYRKIKNYKEKWPSWILHWLKWKRSNNKWDKLWNLEYYANLKKYKDFGPTLFAEEMEKVFEIKIHPETIRRKMIEWWRWLVKPRKVVIERTKRTRRSSYGIMVQFDWSYHDRLETWEVRCMLIAVDDATSKIIEAKFAKNERLIDIIEFWQNYFNKHGKPASIYLDRHSSYKVNHPQDQFDEEMLTRFQRAMIYLWVEIIYAKSAQWKGRVERKFWVLQDRWIKMFRLANIKDYKNAQDYLDAVVVPELNKKFWKEAEKPWDFHIPMTDKDWKYFEWYFAKRSKRTINKIWIIQYMNKRYQIPKWQKLEWTNRITILESHLWNIQIWNWKICLPFTTVCY